VELSIGVLCGLKNRKAGLDRPLKVGGGIQPLLVTVLTPATTFTVGEDFIQNGRRVNTLLSDICCFSLGKNAREPRSWERAVGYLTETRRHSPACSITCKKKDEP